jgi:hypothetical protein
MEIMEFFPEQIRRRKMIGALLNSGLNAFISGHKLFSLNNFIHK